MLIQRTLSPIEEQVIEHIEITQAPPPPPAETQEQDEDTRQDEPDAPSFVAVTLETPNISFSVPTVGGVLVSAQRATAPPMRPPVAKKEAAPATFNLQLTGAGGDYPAPPFPQEFIRRGIQGTVMVKISVDPDGRKQNVEIEQSSGYSQLDEHIKLWVNKYYVRFDRAEGPRFYRAMFTFKIDR
jgi:protein TonB